MKMKGKKMSKNEHEETLCKIELPVLAKDIFRIWALRSIALGPAELAERLDTDKVFAEFCNAKFRTPRLDWKNKKPFAYTHPGLEETKKTNWKQLSDMTEREMCSSRKGFFDREFPDSIGKVVDYEIPLDEERDSARGKIDLLSYRKDRNTLYLIEVKKCDSTELPLRAFFEIFTFWKTLQDSNGKFTSFLNLYHNSEYNGFNVVPALLWCEGSPIYEMLVRGDKEKHVKNLYKRFKDRNVKLFTYKNTSKLKDGRFDVSITESYDDW